MHAITTFQRRNKMIGTLVSLIIAAGTEYFALTNPQAAFANLPSLLLVVGSLFLLLPILIYIFAFQPLQNAEHNMTPRILELFRKDSLLGYIKLWLIVFPLATLTLVLYPELLERFHWGIAVWIVAFGVSIDCLHALYRRLIDYCNPISVIKRFSQEADVCIREEREIDLCHWFDGLSDIASKAINTNSTSIAGNALNEMQQLTRRFLEASKSIGHHAQDKQTEELGIQDKVSYTLFYLYQRLEQVNNRSLEKRLQSICSLLITLFGKITIDAAKYDISLASYPLYYIGKFSREALNKHLPEVVETTQYTLLAVSKEILAMDLTYLEIRDPFLSIINSLEEIARETFKQNKSINMLIIKQPFNELKQLFNTEKLANHPDVPVIIQNIDRVVGEFDALEMVLKTMPPIPKDES